MKDFEKRFNEATRIFIPKGENRRRVLELLENNDANVPDFSDTRCLHAC